MDRRGRHDWLSYVSLYSRDVSEDKEMYVISHLLNDWMNNLVCL